MQASKESEQKITNTYSYAQFYQRSTISLIFCNVYSDIIIEVIIL